MIGTPARGVGAEHRLDDGQRVGDPLVGRVTQAEPRQVAELQAHQGRGADRLGVLRLIAQIDASAAGQPEPDVVPVGAEGLVDLVAGHERELLQALVPVVRQGQGERPVRAGQPGGGDQHRDDLQADGEGARARVLLPPVHVQRGHRAVAGQVAGRRRDRVVGALGHRHAEFVELAREQQRERDLVQLHRRLRVEGGGHPADEEAPGPRPVLALPPGQVSKRGRGVVGVPGRRECERGLPAVPAPHHVVAAGVVGVVPPRDREAGHEGAGHGVVRVGPQYHRRLPQRVGQPGRRG
jgi:hypothetical protein